MRITSVTIVTAFAVALSIGMVSRAQAAEPAAQSMTFTGVVQGVNAAQGVLVVSGPKPGAQGGQVNVNIMISKIFKIDRTTTVSVTGKSNAGLADVKNGDPIQVSFVQSPDGQFLAKSVTDSGRPAANQTPQPPRY